MSKPFITDRKLDAMAVRSTLIEALRKSAKSREQIADEMSALLGVVVTARMLYAFTAESKEEHRWPAEFDVALCEVMGDYTLLAQRVKRAGFRMIGQEEEELMAIGRAYKAKLKAEKKLAGVKA